MIEKRRVHFYSIKTCSPDYQNRNMFNSFLRQVTTGGWVSNLQIIHVKSPLPPPVI